MKSGTCVLILLITAAAMCAETSAQSGSESKAQKAAVQTRSFSSEMGFDLSYPAEWTYIDLGPLLPAAKMDLDKQSQDDPIRRSIECSQIVFSAHFGEPRSVFLANAITTECMRQKPDLESFTARTMQTLAGRYELSQTRYATYSLEGQRFWVMRSAGTMRRDPIDVETIEYVATVLPKGLVYWSAHCRNRQAQAGFEHAHLHLAGGVDTELIPAGAFDVPIKPPANFAVSRESASAAIDAMEVPNASHRFMSSLGFDYQVPRDFLILDTGKWEAAHRVDTAGQTISSTVPEARRRHALLVAIAPDHAQLLILTACSHQCLGSGYPSGDLTLLLANDTLDLARKYDLRETEYGKFSAGSHSFWAMRSRAALKSRPAEPERFLALLIARVSDGVAEYFLECQTREELDALMATRLSFEDGAETRLIPAEAFSPAQRQEIVPFQSPIAAPASAAPPAVSTPPASAANAPEDLSREAIVIEHLDRVYTYAPEGTGVRQFTVAARVQSDAALRQLGVVAIPFASGSEHVELAYVRVRRADGSVTETPVSEAIELPAAVTTAAPFYSDLKELQIPVRSLRVGDRLEWQAKIVRTKPEAPGQFWGAEEFEEDEVVLSQTVELHVPAGMYVNVWSPTSKPVESVSAGEHVYRWESSHRQPTVGPAAEAEKERKKKQLWTAEQELDEKQGKLPSVAWTTFKNWDEVGAWYRGLEAGRILPSDPAVQAKVAELTAGKNTEEEKVRAVYSYVSTQIRYVGVDFDIGRYQPHRAAEVLENQYGDCKDKHTLLASMLSALGLHPQAALIGEGIRFNLAVPSPQSFNHLITKVAVDGQPVWLGSTAEVAPYRVLKPAIRDKDALVIPDAGTAGVERTPAGLPFPAIDNMNASGTLDVNGVSNSRIDLTLRGDVELAMRFAFHQVSPGQYDQIVQQFSLGMGYGGVTSHAEVSRPEDTADPLKISYDYKREKAGDWDHLRIIPQVTPVDLPHPEESEPPVHSIPLGSPRTEISTSAMKLPAGWSAELPAPVHAKSSWATYDETYRFENGTVFAERKIQVLQEKVPVSEWKSYKKFADDTNLGSEKYIQLSIARDVTAAPNSARDKASPTSPPASISRAPDFVIDDPKASRLINAARLSIQHREFESAQSQLDQARSLNPNQSRLWTNYGYLEFQRGNMSGAIDDYRKELSLYPDNYGTYSSLAEAQNILGQEAEAQQTLRTWAKVQPDSSVPVVALVNLLLDQRHPEEAVAAAQDGIARLSEMNQSDQRLQMLTGKAQIAAGMKQKGQATLEALLRTTTDPGMMNDAAYELAKAGLDLPLAESATRDALDRATAESKTWTLHEDAQNALAKSRLIASMWDTVGWILYRQGKAAEAEGYIQPAWLNREIAEIGSHLAQIEQDRGNADEALRLWELSLAAFPSYLRPSVRRTPGATQAEMTSHIEALRKAGAKEPADDADDTLARLRTVSLGSSGGFTGSAEYRLLLGEGRVLDFEKTGDKEVPLVREKLDAAQLAAYWPKGSESRLVRSASVNCHAGICELVFLH
jgi:tetratricopeptide (TPR) repeat protein